MEPPAPAPPTPAPTPAPPTPALAPAPAPHPAAPPAPPAPADPSPVALSALLEDDHATSDAPVRNAHYAETFETTDAALRVRVYSQAEGLDITFPCEPGEYVLDAAERAGHELPFSCRGGGCIVCAGRLDEGEVEMDEQYVLDEDHIADRFRLLCCTTVKTDAVFESHLEDAVD
jgi:ferredoxin